MVNRPLDPNTIGPWGSTFPKVGYRRRDGRVVVNIRWPDKLYDQILTEAKRSGRSFSAMVRHLCEASIEGIE